MAKNTKDPQLRQQLGIRYDPLLVDHLRKAVANLKGRVTMTSILEAGLRRELRYLWAQYNNGKPFGPVKDTEL